MSTMVTGVKTYSGSINVDGRGRPIERTIAKLARDRGKRIGVVSSVQLTHATPAAAAGAHQFYRNAYCEIAVEVLAGPYPDVLAGCGHPDFDHAGGRHTDDTDRQYEYVGGKEIWDFLTGSGNLKAGQQVCVRGPADQPQGISLSGEQIANLERWTLRQSRAEIEALAQGPTPDKLLIVPQVGESAFWGGVAPTPEDPYAVKLGGTLQQQRGSRANGKFTAPGDDPLIETVPSLETLTRVALNALDDADGFFLHVEGGAVDWAMHGNQLGRMIEEMQDFKRSIETVVSWVERHGGWNETLLIVTADHDHMLWGPNADSTPFDPLVDNGAGRMPSYHWLDNSHSNALVPLFARGPGAESFTTRANGSDPFYGLYVDQVDVFEVMQTAFVPPGK
jgi:alkaline phosphatase